MKPIRRTARPVRGFALIITLTLMVLLTVVAIGLLTLGSVTLRSASTGVDQAVARANARMALMLAIGDLQKHAGPDTRITAKADILDASNPPIMGVWKSWEGTDHEQTGSAQGRPISPGNYKTKKQERFQAWLVSGSTTTLPNTTKGSTKAILLGDNSVGSGATREKLQVHLTPTPLTTGNQRGSFAWWVSGENQKARLPKPYQPSADNSGRWAMNAKSHSVADPKPFRLESLLSDATPANKAISLMEGDLIATAGTLKSSQEFFHDLSASSVGLLTNVATGGWKKDLSLLTENWSRVGTSGLPFFRIKPGQDLLATIPAPGNASPDKSLLYPWSSYRGTAANIPIYQHGAVSSWENLKDFALAYRDKGITTSPSGKCTMTPYSVAIDGDAFGFLHRVRVLPVIARIEWLFSHTAAQVATPAGSFEPRLLITPVITMWNPYNVEMNFSNVPLAFRIPRPLPAALQYSVNGIQNSAYNSLLAGSVNNTPALSSATEFNYRISSPFVLKPGDTRVFSPAATQVAANTILELQPGYRSRGGHFLSLRNDAGATLVAPGTATIRARAKFDTTYNDVYQGVGIYLDMSIAGVRHLAYRMVYKPQVATEVYKPVDNLPESPPLNVVATAPSPFLTTVFGARMASRSHVAAKGFVQSSPLVNYTAMGGKDEVESTILKHYGGTSHPVNSPFDYSFEPRTPNDSKLPNSDASNRGFIVTGFNKSNGLSRCVINELPLRPLQSLAELQNWDLRYENPIPPFSYNIIGNSDATPLLPSNAVVNSADAGQGTNLQHDDSYCANHLLFDDWFVSSIAPDPTTFGNSGRTLQKTYTDFVSGVTPLPNRAYVPIAQDASLGASSTSAANTLFSNNAGRADSWRTIASRLEVEGMFNVNSTSVTAWRALLGHARNQKVPFLRDSGAAWSVELSGQSDYAFSRFSIAGDADAKSTGSSGAFPGANEFVGYRILDERMIDALAAEIVKQVRLRGPFLSLSEFVNRQLSSGDLALAGTVQAALNEIAKSASTNPYSGMTSGEFNNPSSATPASAASAEYKFPDAAIGQATYGLPGWTRQADVLRALAPTLTARDDTFTLRAYGDARDKSGNITARATCEAVVVRTRNYVDPADLAEVTGTPTRQINQIYGRRFQIVSMRWLSPSEI